MATKKKPVEESKPKMFRYEQDANSRYLAGGRSPATRAAKYQGSRVSRGINTVPLKPERLAKLKEQEAVLHASLTSDAGRSATRVVHESAGVTSPAMQAKERAPKLSQGQVRGETFSIPPKTEKPKMAAKAKTSKPASPAPAPAGKTIDQVADSKARRKAAATKAAAKQGRTTGTRYLPGTKEYAMVRSDKQSTGAGGPEEAKIAALAKPKETKAPAAPAAAKPKRTRKPALSKMAAPNAADRVTGIPAPEGVVHKPENIMTTRHGAKAPETDHIQPQQYFGKHVKVHDLASVTKNAKGSVDAPSVGRHSAERVGRGKHAGGYNEAYDAHRTALVGSVAYGRHARSM